MKTFAAHGNATIELTGRVFVITPAGPGNAEEMARVLAAIGAQLQAMPPGPWAVLLVAEADMLLTPDAEEFIAAALPALLGNGLLATALAILNENVRTVLQVQFGRMFAPANAQLGVFDETGRARAWLEAKLAGGVS